MDLGNRFNEEWRWRLAITMNTHAASERILFDFQASTNSSAWQIVNDEVMGGVSTSRFQILTNGGAVFSGVGSLENNGGFASVRSAPARHRKAAVVPLTFSGFFSERALKVR